jgi:hypothetical protein
MAGHRYGNSGSEWTLNHHSLNPYGGHGMVLQHHLLSHASKQHHSFAQNLRQFAKHFANSSSKGMAGQ